MVLVVDVVVEVVVVVVDAAAIVAADAVTAASLIELAEGEEDENELEVVDMDAEVKEDGTEIKMPLRKPYFVLI